MAHLSLLISEHQTSSGVGLKLALSLLGHYSIDKFVIKQICMQYPIYDNDTVNVFGGKLPFFLTLNPGTVTVLLNGMFLLHR